MSRNCILENRYESIHVTTIDSDQGIKFVHQEGGWLKNFKDSFSYEKGETNSLLPKEFLPNVHLVKMSEDDIEELQHVVNNYSSILAKYPDHLEFNITLRIVTSLEYKFQLMHQQRGFEGSCHYGEGVCLENEYWFSWCENRKIGIEFIQSLM